MTRFMFGKRGSIFVIILGIIVLLATLLTGYVWWQGQKPKNETANWEIYSDGRISFKYPSAWEIQPVQLLGSGSSTEFRYQLTPTLTLYQKINYNQGTEKPFSWQEWLTTAPAGHKEFTVDNHPATRWFHKGDGGHTLDAYEATIFDGSFTTLYYEPGYYNNDTVVFDQILSTFKFLDQNSTELDRKAIQLVKNLPEVKNWLALFSNLDGTSPKTGGKPVFDIENRNGSIYTVRAYEYVPSDAHRATLNVFDVNIETGTVTKEFNF